MNNKISYKKSGFTLIELLVVVLIIGVLTAIALPRYETVVMKTRYTQLMTITNALVEAEKRYYLATGNYTPYFDQLDIEMPEGGVTGGDPAGVTYITYKKFTIRLLNAYNCASAILPNSSLSYYYYYDRPHRQECRCMDDRTCLVCETLGGVYGGVYVGGSGETYYLFK